MRLEPLGGRLGDLLIEAGLLSREQLAFALGEQKRTGVRLSQILIDHGLVEEAPLFDALAQSTGLTRLDFQNVEVRSDVAEYVSGEWALDNAAMPLRVDKNARTLFLAMSDPTNVVAMDDLAFKTGLKIEMVIGSESEIQRLVRHKYFGEPLDRSTAGAKIGHPVTSDIQFDPLDVVHGMDAIRDNLHRDITDVPEPKLPSNLPAGARLADGSSPDEHPDDELNALSQLKPIADAQQEAARALRAIFELCVDRGIIQREHYLQRLKDAAD